MEVPGPRLRRRIYYKWSGLGPELAKELGGFGAMVGAADGDLVRLGG